MIGLLLAALLGPPSPEELGVPILKPEPQDVRYPASHQFTLYFP